MAFTPGPLRLLAAAALLAGPVGLGGCGNRSASTTATSLPSATAPPPTTTPPSTTSATTTTTTAPTTTSAPSTTTTTSEPTTTTSVAPTTTTEKGVDKAPAWFTTPSGNIGCRVSEGGARCDVAKAKYNAPPAKPGCDLDAGSFFGIEAKGAKGESLCVGDTVAGGPKLSKYPARATAGPMSCDITEDGVTCKNAGGHGFFVSVQSYKLF